MIPESITLATKGFFLVIGAGLVNVVTSVAQTVSEPTEFVKGVESLGTHGLLLLGIWYLYRANQRLEGDLRKFHEEQKASSAEQVSLLKDELQESRDSRDRLYEAIKGSLATKNSND